MTVYLKKNPKANQKACCNYSSLFSAYINTNNQMSCVIAEYHK